MKILIYFLLVLCTLVAFSSRVFTQGVGLGTNSPTQILHLYESGSDVAIRHQTLNAGTGPEVPVGPNSVVTPATDVTWQNGPGTITWTTPENAGATGGGYATATMGSATSEWLQAINFGFALPATTSIDGITVEIEKSYTQNPVALKDAWASAVSTANQTTYGGFSFNNTAGGTNRLMVVCVYTNDDGGIQETLNAVTYGGAALTKQEGVTEWTSSDDSDLEIWYLNEAGLAGVGTGNLAFSFTWSGGVADNQYYSAAIYEYVDQTTPILASTSNATINNVTTYQLGASLPVETGDYIIFASGTEDGTGTSTPPAGYTERRDLSGSTGGEASCFAVDDKAIVADGSEQPTSTFSVARDHLVAAIVLNNNPSVTDATVQLVIGGVPSGNDQPSAVPWTTTDAYTTYGGSTDNWGLAALSEADINAANFGVIISCTGNNVIPQIDHIRITVDYTVNPPAYQNFTTGLDYSTGTYTIAAAATLGTASDCLTLDATGNGTFTGTVTASCGVLICSDLRYKKKIVPLNNALNSVFQLKGIEYYWKTDEFPEKHFGNEKQIGFIAQDLEKIYPELVHTDKNGFKTVNYAGLTPILVEAIKEQQIQIDELRKQMTLMRAENEDLSRVVDQQAALEAKVSSMENIINELLQVLGAQTNKTSE